MIVFAILKRYLLSGMDGEGILAIIGFGLLLLLLIYLVDFAKSRKKKQKPM